MKKQKRSAKTGGLLLLSAAFAMPAGWADERAGSRGGAVSPLVPHQSVALLGPKRDYATAPIDLAIDLPPLDLREAARPATRVPVRIGVHRDVPVAFRGDLAPRLSWAEIADGAIVTSLSLSSPGAFSVRMGLVAELPEGGEIRLFDPSDPSRRFPAVTVDDFLGDSQVGPEVVWLPSVAGEVAGIEITLPSREAIGSFSLTLEKIAHRQENTRASGHGRTLSPKALSCPDIDAQCRIGFFRHRSNPAIEIENAVGLMQVEEDGYSWQCSGTLLNVPATDEFEPYFLTANHCVNTSAAARSVEVTWFYQRESCGSLYVDQRASTTSAGADLLATSVAQDSTLLRLRGTLPGGLVYSGWRPTGVAHPNDVFNFSHPQGEIRKFAAGVTTKTTHIDELRNAYAVRWYEGATEPGSSGSGLFDGGYLIGVLSGSDDDSCGATDYFGSLEDFYPTIRRWIDPSISGGDDHGNAHADATGVSLPSETAGTIHPGTDVDYFRFDVPTRGTVTVESTGSLDTIGTLYSSSGSRIDYNDDGGTGYNFRIRRVLDGGTYYVGVGSFWTATGRYTLRLSGLFGENAVAASYRRAFGDFNGDGKDDVLLRHSDGRWHYYPMDGRRVLAGAGEASLTGNPTVSAAGVGDLDGDGRDDVLVRRANGSWYYYPMTGRRHHAGRGEVSLPSDLAWRTLFGKRRATTVN